MTEEFHSCSEHGTRQIARRFAASLHPGDIISLSGQFGAGKTVFMRGIAEFFNCDEQLSSPTFSLFNIYQGTFGCEEVALHHFDLYRIKSLRELDAIGFDEYLLSGYLSIVEWADRFPDYASLYTHSVSLEYTNDKSRRILCKRTVR